MSMRTNDNCCDFLNRFQGITITSPEKQSDKPILTKLTKNVCKTHFYIVENELYFNNIIYLNGQHRLISKVVVPMCLTQYPKPKHTIKYHN